MASFLDNLRKYQEEDKEINWNRQYRDNDFEYILDQYGRVPFGGAVIYPEAIKTALDRAGRPVADTVRGYGRLVEQAFSDKPQSPHVTPFEDDAANYADIKNEDDVDEVKTYWYAGNDGKGLKKIMIGYKDGKIASAYYPDGHYDPTYGRDALAKFFKSHFNADANNYYLYDRDMSSLNEGDEYSVRSSIRKRDGQFKASDFFSDASLAETGKIGMGGGR